MTQVATLALLLACGVGFCLPAPGQQTTGSIRGVIYDKDFDVPLAGARVVVVETGQKATSADGGHFVIAQVPAGKYTLVITSDGYVRQVKADVAVAAGSLTDVDVSLAGEFTELDELVVQDTLQLGGGTEVGLLQLRLESPALMDSISGELMNRAGAGDAASALKLVAGASVQGGKSAVIRGLPDRYISSQLNGVRLPTADENKRAVALDQFPSTVIDSIQVSKTFTPDQQGDASGGAVNIRLKGIPDEPFFARVKTQGTYNSQTSGRSDFLTYEGGGVPAWGRDGGARRIQTENEGLDWTGAVGVSRGDSPFDHKSSVTFGGRHEFDNGWKVGGLANVFYERKSSFFDNGIDDSKWVETPGAAMTPRFLQGTPTQGDFRTALFDVTQSTQSVQRGGLFTAGVENKDHAINVVYLNTVTAEDTVTLAQDTRGKQYYFPGYDPNNPASPGYADADAAPYVRLETLDYIERETQTLQLNGRHKFPLAGAGAGASMNVHALEFDWGAAFSSATSSEPDKRQFGSIWQPAQEIIPGFVLPAHFSPFKPADNYLLGNLQRIFKDIREDSQQFQLNLKAPFENWTGEEGYFKTGLFSDHVDRTYTQQSFSNFDNFGSFDGNFDQFWSTAFPTEGGHPITGSLYDVDYTGQQTVQAVYGMTDMPLVPTLHLIGGLRFETTRIGIQIQPEALATWFPAGSYAPQVLLPGDADVAFQQSDVLPSIGLDYRPSKQVTLRASYNETIARQTFKELTPIIQQEYLGGPVFIGNPALGMSAVKNYDFRVDYAPYEGGLLSGSLFRKDLRNPIEYVQRLNSFVYTTATNYPTGMLQGIELEARSGLDHLWSGLEGVSAGANATFIHSEVELPATEAANFDDPGIRAPLHSREMTNAPARLFNIFATYDIPSTGTHLGLFYTVQGDTLLAGAGVSLGNFVPSVFAREFGTLNASVTQDIGEHLKLQFQAKNLTNPTIDTVYRSQYIGGDVLKTSFTRGIELSLGLSAEFKF